MDTVDILRTLSYTCSADTTITDEDGDPVPLFIVRDANGNQVAYGISEKIAWESALEMARYRGLLNGSLES